MKLLLALLLLAAPLAPPAAAQTRADSLSLLAAMTARNTADADSSYKRTGSEKIRGWQKRIIARTDSILRLALKLATVAPVVRVDTVTVLKRDTIYVAKVDTAVTPVPTPTPIDPTPVVTAGVIFVHPFAPPTNGAAFAELPRDTVPIDVPAPTRTIAVVSLQQALDTARTGDRLLIPRNSRTEQLQVRPTARTGWVTIQGTDSTSVITTSGTSSQSAIAILSRAHHVRLLGPLRVTATGTGELTAMLRSYNYEALLADFPHDIIVDGVTFDAGTSLVRRCVWGDGIRIAVVRSRLLNCATQAGDAQAILILGGPGPYRFEGNYLQGSHQCFNSGGGDPVMPGLVPSDVVFRNNVCEKPLRWHYTTPGVYTGEQRQVKTVIETKNIRRGLFEYNTIRNVWPDAQTGFAFLLKSVNQDGGCTWCTTSDVTVRYNRVINVAAGFNLSANPQGIVVPLTRVSLYGNVVEKFGEGEGIAMQLLGATRDVILMHNTFATAGNAAMVFDEAPGIRTVVSANVIPSGQYGVKGNSTSTGTATITKWMPGGIWSSNALLTSDCSVYPVGTYCTLPSPLPLAPDGTAIGADAAKVPAP